jgi:hypothetical protein
MAGVWRKPDAGAGYGSEVWREKPFEIVLDGVWFTGIFDRVIVKRDASARAVEAWVIDFKTDRPPPGGEGELLQKHAPQLGLYRRVAAVLMELPAESVRCSLALVSALRLVDVPFIA